MLIEPTTAEDLYAALDRAADWLRTALDSKHAPSGSGIRKARRELELNADVITTTAIKISELCSDPQLSEAQRIARLMLAIADSQAIRATRDEDVVAVQTLLDQTAVLLVAAMTKVHISEPEDDSAEHSQDAADLGILDQGSFEVFLYYISDRGMTTRERSLARACEDTLSRTRRAGSRHRAAPRLRPEPGKSAICGIGTPVTRVTDVQQAESLRRAEPVERAIRDAEWLPDVPGRDIVPSLISLAHAEERDEESESTLMSYAAFVGVDGEQCALGMGMAVRSMELWGCPVLVFGSYPAGDSLARVYSGSMNGRWSRPMLDDENYLYDTTTEFLKAKRSAILLRAEFLASVIAMPSEPLEALHAEVLAADRFAFDATSLTHRRALFLTERRAHWAHAQDHEVRAMRELGLHPVSRHPFDLSIAGHDAALAGPPAAGRSTRRDGAASGPDRGAGIRLELASLQTLKAVAREQRWSGEQQMALIESAMEPTLALSRSTAVIQSRDWIRIAQREGLPVR